jgi:hypothetical protein
MACYSPEDNDSMALIISNFVPFVKYCFFATSIKDIYRAIRGGALLGAFSLSVCSIDAMAFLGDALPGKGTKANFIKWVEDWMGPLNSRCKPDVLYGVRCGLVHTYSYGKALEDCGVERIIFTHNKPRSHWDYEHQLNTLQLKLESHIAEMTVAAFDFFKNLDTICATYRAFENELIMRANQLTYVQSITSAVSKGPFSFEKIDGAFKSLDFPREPRVDTMVQAIREIFPKGGLTYE